MLFNELCVKLQIFVLERVKGDIEKIVVIVVVVIMNLYNFPEFVN